MATSNRDSQPRQINATSQVTLMLSLHFTPYRRNFSFEHGEIWWAIHVFARGKNVFTRKESRLVSVDYEWTSSLHIMGDFNNNSRSFSHRRDLWSRDRTPPQRAKRETPSAHASSDSTDPSVKMALTCKVQYLDDTDPFASTNFPEPTRPPTYTFHLNIPLFQQIGGLHRLLNAPHNVSSMLFISLFTFSWNFVLSLALSVQICFNDWR